MTQSHGPIDAKFLSQWEAVRGAALDDGVVLALSRELSGNRTTPAYAYEKDHVFVREQDVDEVVGRHLDGDWVRERSVENVRLYKIGEDAVDVVGRVNSVGSLRTDVTALNTLHSICPVQLCPADEPVPLPVDGDQEPHPPRTWGTVDKDDLDDLVVRVDVLDTGLVPGYEVGHDWLADITSFERCTIFGPAGLIKLYAGHGTFVTGVLRCAAPKTEVRPINVFRYAGATTADKLANALLAALERKPDIISLSAGGATLGGQPSAALEPFIAKLTHPDNQTLLVAAAGNDGHTRKFYPAAYAADHCDAVVSVGALRYDSKGRACFSNYGDWVRVYALGERHVNAFMSGGYSYVDPQRPDLTCRFHPDRLYCACTCVTMPPHGAVVAFRGMARWSGTSFATPLVAGLIARHMSDTGETNARKAAQQVLATTRAIIDTDGEPLDALDYGLVL